MKKLILLQLRVLGALVLRETRATFGTSQLGYLWALLVPMGSVAVLVVIFSIAGRHPPFGPSLALFFSLGLFVLEYFKKLANTLMTSIQANQALLTYPLIKEVDTLIARFILISATYFLIIVIFVSILFVLGLAELPYRPEQCLMALAVTGLLGFGFGCCNAILYSVWESWKNIEKILMAPLFFLSGIFYVPSNLPPAAIDILRWNPVLHLVEWLRDGYYINYDSAVLDKSYTLSIALCLVFLGLAGQRLFRKKMRFT